MLTTTGLLSYTIIKSDKYDFVPMVLNPNFHPIDYAFYDVSNKCLIVGFENEDDEMELLDYGFPSKEFITALNDVRADGALYSNMKVHELAHNSIHETKLPSKTIKVLMMEEVFITDFKYSKGLMDNRHAYRLTLDNGHVFNLIMSSDRDPALMKNTSFNNIAVAVDQAIWCLCRQYKLFEKEIKNGNFQQCLFDRFMLFTKIYLTKKIDIDMDVLEECTLSCEINGIEYTHPI